MSAMTLVIGLGVGFGVASCSPQQNQNQIGSESGSPTPSASEEVSVSSADLGNKTQAGAKATLDAFFKQLADELPEYEKGITGDVAEGGERAVFTEKFSKTLSYLKPGAFNSQEDQDLIGSFSQLYIFDREAKIASSVSDYALNGDEAVIKGTDFVLTVGGKVQEQQIDPSRESGTITLMFENGKWLITKFSTGN